MLQGQKLYVGCLILRWGTPARCARVIHVAAGPLSTRPAPSHAQLNPTIILSPLARKFFCGAYSPVCSRIPVRESSERCVLMCPCFWMFVCAVCMWVVVNNASDCADCFSSPITTHNMDLTVGPVFAGTCSTVCFAQTACPAALCRTFLHLAFATPPGGNHTFSVALGPPGANILSSACLLL